MAEKRKLPPRAGREPAAKKRVSEASTPQPQKKKAPTPRAPSPPPPPVDAPLPAKIRDGEGLPIIRARQPTVLSDQEYQSIAERFDHHIHAADSNSTDAFLFNSHSAVALASLERSKKKWLSDGILVRYYTKPKKTKREQIAQNNPPKESMTRVGPCDVTVGPHLFDAMLYTVKDPNAPPSIQYAPPQRPMVHYGHPNTFQQYQPYPSPSNQQRKPAQYSPAPPGRPQGYPGGHPPAAQRGPQPSPQSGQRPPQAQKAPAGQPAKPSPDPVIQMLATRAAADPELKALMRVVASSQATQEQLRAFQAHIDELNAIIKSREQQEQRQQTSAGTPVPQQATPASENKSTPSEPARKPETEAKPLPQEQTSQRSQPATQTQASSKDSQPKSTPSKHQPATQAEPKAQGKKQSEPQPQTPAQTQSGQPSNASQKSTEPSAVKQEPAATGPSNAQATPSEPGRPAVPTPSATPGPVSTPGSNQGSQQQAPVVQPTPPAGNVPQASPRPGLPNPSYPQPQYGGHTPIQSRLPQYAPPASYYRPTGPPPPPPRVGYKSVVFEFTSPLTPYGSSTSGHAGSGDRYLFPEYSILEWIPTENIVLASFLVVRKVDPNAPFPIEPVSDTANARGKGKGASKSKKGKAEKGKESTDLAAPNQVPPSGSATDTPQKPASSDTPKPKPDPATPNNPTTPVDPAANQTTLKEYWQPVTFRIHATSLRILEPLSRVVKPADEVRKYMNEVMDRAERAPDGFLALRLPHEEAQEAFEAEGTPASGTGTRSRFSRGGARLAEDESEVENLVADLEEEEEDLIDFYGMPSSLPPLGV
ncbi:hypothetical protein NUU61_005426 [Penicillium alfredii]|uniref:SWR1-complex protein 3 domain-containing protein n=1 Tax=Penicillium alfredii TaxID=1506179 RepID=A0A9W9F9M0_9EURO|nr:uncharacterized protein NUU61_005426 [Penicillium alfredii]KAJ5096070.1 hypothetical protein NUU61_005426 [Penicillium alfredii]